MEKNMISYYSLILNVSTHVVSASLFQLKKKYNSNNTINCLDVEVKIYGPYHQSVMIKVH